MEHQAADIAASETDGYPHLRPICATFWSSNRDSGPTRYELCTSRGRDAFGEAFQLNPRATVWVEASLEGLEVEELAWYGDSLDVWRSADVRPIDWAEMAPVLRSLSLETPTVEPVEGEPVDRRLLRALPYVLSRGVFEAIGDISIGEAGPTWNDHEGQLTAFPTIGSHIDGEFDGEPGSTYTVIRTIVGVVGQVVITLRLPDLRTPRDLEQVSPNPASMPLQVPDRYFPLRRQPRALEIAEVIGVHQADTVRSVMNQIDDELTIDERLVRVLRESSSYRGGNPRRQLRQEVGEAARRVDRMAEVTRELEQQASRLLRRFSSKIPNAPEAAASLVPRGVSGGYDDLVDELRLLQEKCRHTAESAIDSLEAYDKGNRERFQLFAAVLASLALIPTLYATLFNIGFPTEKEGTGFFWVGLIVILDYVLIAGLALRKAQAQDWYLSRREAVSFLGTAALVGLAVVGSYALLL
jgi:hypothetical protein